MRASRARAVVQQVLAGAHVTHLDLLLRARVSTAGARRVRRGAHRGERCAQAGRRVGAVGRRGRGGNVIEAQVDTRRAHCALQAALAQPRTHRTQTREPRAHVRPVGCAQVRVVGQSAVRTSQMLSAGGPGCVLVLHHLRGSWHV